MRNELAELEQINFLNFVDMQSILYPKSAGLESLEINLLGSTCVSTEGLMDRIKSRVSKTIEKAKMACAKIGKIISEKKWWIAGGLAVVAAFATAAIVLVKKSSNSKDEAKDLKKNISNLYNRAKEQIKEHREKVNDKRKRKAEAKYDQKPGKKYNPDRKKREESTSRLIRNKLVVASNTVKSTLSKIINAAKELFGMSKESQTLLPKLQQKVNKKPGNEGFGAGVLTYTGGALAIPILAVLGAPAMILAMISIMLPLASLYVASR